ncbi:bile acid-CoA:amino acid N-acyltransferase [Rhinophrynus dorsalis]
MIGLAATPEIALADEPVRICAWGLPPQQVITLRAWVEDERRQIFHSRAFYVTDMEGKVDLDSTPATGGDFNGVYPMGLFWSLKPITPFLRLIKRNVVGSPLRIHLELYTNVVLSFTSEDPPSASKVLERWFAAPGVQRIQVRDGRVRGALFLPPGEGPFPGIIDMFGGVGGLVEFRSAQLASRGMASLALAYFGYEDLPSSLETVDLKYFEEAAQYLLSNPKVLGDGVGVVSVSKGAEIALCMASYLPQVKATVCINGTNAVNGNSVQYGDVFMAGIPYEMEKLLIKDNGATSFINTMADTRKPENQACVVPLEKARGPILFFVGEDDQIWDTLLFAKEALTRARKHGKNNVHVVSYPGAGHLLEPPGSPFCPVSQSLSFPLPMMWGGELLAHCIAQEICWKEMQEFLHKHLGQNGLSKL